MNPAALLDFLADLALHNERDWFQTHKARYDQLRLDFEANVAYWLAELAPDEPALAGLDPRQCVFRIYRDVRFSKNKAPYKTHFSAYFSAGGKAGTTPGRYLQVGPGGQTLIAGGLYEPDKAQLAAVRQEIDYAADSLRALLAAPRRPPLLPAGPGGRAAQENAARLRAQPPRSQLAAPQAVPTNPRAARRPGARPPARSLARPRARRTPGPGTI